jgi:hypothetical protein
VLQHRQHLGEQEPLPHPVDGEPAVAGPGTARGPQPQRQLPLGQAVQAREIVDGLLGGEVLLVRGGEGVGHPREQPLGLVPVPGREGVGEIVGPAPRRRREL